MRKYSKRLFIAAGLILLLSISSLVSTLYVGSNKKSALSERKADHYGSFSTQSEDILFIGDDVTAEAPLLDMFPSRPIRNRGIVGDLSHDILARSADLAYNKPAIVFLNFGANDIRLRVPIKQIVANYREVISLFSSLSPTTEIVITATLPLNEFSRTAAESLNKELKKIAELRSLNYIDLPAQLLDESGHFIPGAADKSMHLLGPSYKTWQQLINSLVLEKQS